MDTPVHDGPGSFAEGMDAGPLDLRGPTILDTPVHDGPDLSVLQNDDASYDEGARPSQSEVRREPESLREQLAMAAAKRGEGNPIPPEKLTLQDPRYPANKWEKVQYKHTSKNGEKIHIHYMRNKETGEMTDFKFINLKVD